MRDFLRNIKFLSIVGGAFVMAGCDLSTGNDEPVPDLAFVQIYQASPNAPTLRIILDEKAVTNSLDYADNTGYLNFITGERTIEFGPAGASNIVADTTMTFEKNKAYSIFFVDTFTHPELFILNDDVTVPAGGKAKIRFLNLSPDAPEVNLTAGGVEANLFTGQAFKETSNFIELDAKKYTFFVKNAAGDVLLTLTNSDLREGRAYTVIVRGFSEPPAGNTNVLSAELI